MFPAEVACELYTSIGAFDSILIAGNKQLTKHNLQTKHKIVKWRLHVQPLLGTLSGGHVRDRNTFSKQE